MNWKCIGQWLPKTIAILKDYCSLLTIVVQNLMTRWKLQLTDTHTPLTENYRGENQERKGEQKTYESCFKVNIATLWPN